MKTKTALIIAGSAAALFGVYLYTRHRKAQKIQDNLTSLASDTTKVTAPSSNGTLKNGAYGYWGDE